MGLQHGKFLDKDINQQAQRPTWGDCGRNQYQEGVQRGPCKDVFDTLAAIFNSVAGNPALPFAVK